MRARQRSGREFRHDLHAVGIDIDQIVLEGAADDIRPLGARTLGGFDAECPQQPLARELPDLGLARRVGAGNGDGEIGGTDHDVEHAEAVPNLVLNRLERALRAAFVEHRRISCD